MSALPGGAADKLGNRFESWWTLLRIADVLQGRAARIRIEPPGKDGEGVEFWVDEPGLRWYEQVKNAQHSWTLNRLVSPRSSPGVLLAVSGHLADGHQVRLVVSSAAHDLAALSSRARVVTSLDEYESILTEEQLAGFRMLTNAWEATPATAWAYLGRVHVETYPQQNLRRLVHLHYEMLIQGDPEIVVNELRGWLDDVLHQEITAPMIWKHLKAKGFARRLLAGDPDTLQALSGTAERNHRRTEHTRPTTMVSAQSRTAQLVDRLLAADSKQVVMLHGRAGAGKSTVASDALRELACRGWLSAVVRMDNAGHARTAVALGRAHELTASPAVLLAGAADGAPAVLLVDQLDAVSLYSGRMPDSFDAVAELIDQVASLPNIKVVMVVRSVDLKADQRMRSMVSDETRFEELELGDLAASQVRVALEEAGVVTKDMAPATLDLLRVPLHLAVFSSLPKSAQKLAYRTLTDLYEQFTEDVRLTIGREGGSLNWSGTVGALARYMSEHECLVAPSAVVDDAQPSEIAALVSHGVVVKEQRGYAIFHETYFDFIFARSFVASGADLHDFLVSSGQRLFRRSQARQVLEHLAATDRRAFRQIAVRLLTSTEIRPHLHYVVIAVLGQLDARSEDWQAVEPLAFGDFWFGSQLAGLLSLPSWFDAADKAGRWEELLANPSTDGLAAHQLVNAARHRPQRVDALVRPHIGTSETWRSRLLSIVEWSLIPDLVDLAVDLIEGGHLDDARGPIAVNSDFWSIVHRLDADPADAARVIGARLRRSLVQAKKEGASDPFESGHLDTRSSSGGDSLIREVARATPSVFLDQVLPFVIQVAVATAASRRPQELRSSSRWKLRYLGSVHGIDRALFAGVEDALCLLAKKDPQQAAEVGERLGASDVRELRFLFCRLLAVLNAGNIAVDWLLSDERNLTLGWADSPRWASRELIEVVTMDCDEAHGRALAEQIMDHYSEWERSAAGRASHGWSQFELLTAIEPPHRSQAVKRRIGQWQRKFGDEPVTGPRAIEGGRVGPPIPAEAAARMTDEHWLSAIDKYRSDKTNWRADGGLTGGARELALLLGSQAESEPERFARFALRLGPDVPTAHLEHVITAVAGKVPIPLFTELCVYSRGVAGQEVGMAICRAVETVKSDADDALMGVVVNCSTDNDPDHELEQTSDESSQELPGGDLYTAGFNSTRGAAASAIARLLFTNPQRAEVLKPTIAALATDRALAVRTHAAEAVMALMNADLEAALDLAAELFDAPVDVLSAHSTSRLLGYALLNEPDRFKSILCRALDGPETVAELGGRVWALMFVRDLVKHPIPGDVASLGIAARRGAAAALAEDPATAPDQVIRLMDDEDPTVREAAAAAMHVVDTLDAQIAQPLIEAFSASAAFADHLDDLFSTLERSQHLFPEATITACARAIAVAGQDLGDIRKARAAMSTDVIEVILRLYRQGNEGIRVRCLDLIDQLAMAGAYGLAPALAGER